MDLSEKLVQLGFSPNQASVYIALMELGQSKAAAIIKKTGLHRNIVYEALDALEKRLLVFKTSQGGVSLFQLSDASSLVEEASSRLQSAQTIADEINVLRSRSDHEVKLYEGMSGLKAHRNALLADVKDSKEEHLVIAGTRSQKELYEQIFKTYDQQRVAWELPARLLFSQQDAAYADVVGTEAFTKTRLLPYGVQEPTMIDIWQNNVAFMLQDKQPFVISIQSEQLATSFREYFETLWNQDVATYRGLDGLKQVMELSLEYPEHWFIGGNAGIGDVMPDYWRDYNQRRIEKKIWWHDLVDSGKRLDGLNVGEMGVKNHELFVEYKELPPDVSSPMVVFIFGNYVAHIHWQAQYAFVIEDEAVAENYKHYFQYLWNQDLVTVTGLSSVQELFLRWMYEMKPGEEYMVIGANYGEAESARILNPWFVNYHKKRLQYGVQARLLTLSGSMQAVVDEIIEAGDSDMKLTELRVMQKEFTSPMQINIYPKAVRFIYWDVEEKAVAIDVRRKDMRDAMAQYFTALWNTSEKV
jgi:sugar-specific transcriptional regulator TrmB